MKPHTFLDKHLAAEDSAELAGLTYLTEQSAGWTRRRNKADFHYFKANGDRITSERTITHIESLAIPPAWGDVWISPDPKAHILATGTDDAGRKQYIYHPKWREVRDVLNAYRMIFFGKALSEIRSTVKKDFASEPLSKNQVLATLISIIDQTYIRIGDEAYAAAHDSYGLTTLRDKHVEENGDEVTLHFVGKSGKEHELEITDEDLAHAIERCKEVTGRRLFQYVEDGKRHPIFAADVNEYLVQFSDDHFTAKDFRTWGGTLQVFECITQKTYDPDSKKQPLSQAFEQAASCLGNTPAVVRKSYVHPHLIAAIEDESLCTILEKIEVQSSLPHLSKTETQLIAVLEKLFEKQATKLTAT